MPFLQLDTNKCDFLTAETKNLGLVTTTRSIKMDLVEVSELLAWARATGEPSLIKLVNKDFLSSEVLIHIKDLQKFLGFANFYRRFITNFSSVSQPLANLLESSTTWDWDASCSRAWHPSSHGSAHRPSLRNLPHRGRHLLRLMCRIRSLEVSSHSMARMVCSTQSPSSAAYSQQLDATRSAANTQQLNTTTRSTIRSFPYMALSNVPPQAQIRS